MTAKYRRRRNRLRRDVERLTVRQRFIAEVLSGLHEARRAALDRKLEDVRELYLEAGRQLDITIARVREDEPLHHRQLAQLRGELGLSGRLTFCRYLSAVMGR